MNSHFNEIVATGFRPGYLPESDALSVSIPVSELASLVPPRTLVAWDKRLLSQSRYLTLVILNLGGAYPFVRGDGASSQPASNLAFKVGLTTSYKPTRRTVTTSSTEQDTEDEGEDLSQKTLAEELDVCEFDIGPSLSHAMNDLFFKVLRLRVLYKSRWAGSEKLYFKLASEASELPEQEIAQRYHEVCIPCQAVIHTQSIYSSQEMTQADDEEASLLHCYSLPLDPYLERQDDQLNFPLLAFSYLLRRFAVRATID